MKSIFKRATGLILAFACLLSLFGCEIGRADKPPAHSGIDITDDLTTKNENAYSEETENYARGVIAEMIRHYVNAAGVSAFFGEAKQSEATEKIQKITAESIMAEEKYLSFMEVLDESGCAVIDEMLSGEGTENSKALYLSLSDELGADYLGKTLYKLLIWSYEYSYDKSMYEYGEYGYSYKKDDADKALADKNTLINDIGEERFPDVLKSAVAVFELIFGGALESEQMASFSDEEILIFLSYIDFSSLQMNKAGWELILSLFVPKRDSTKAPYIDRVLYTMNREGDLSELAGVMNDLISLIVFVRDGMDGADVQLLREGMQNEFLSRAFLKFGDSEWESFENITSIEVKSSKYETLGKGAFGDEFTAYCEAVEVKTLDELRAAAGNDGFYKTLEGYIAGISPAFSYGMSK